MVVKPCTLRSSLLPNGSPRPKHKPTHLPSLVFSHSSPTTHLHPPPATMQAALCELLGAGASYGYLLLLFRDVDSLQPGDRFPMREAEEVEPKFARWIAKWLASYR